jgi:ketosteroid isomerase-like protein
MQENGRPPRVGREALMANEQRALERMKSIRTTRLELFHSGGDDVAVHCVFELEDRDGRRWGLDEMSLQRWKGDRIAEERFFYDPAQLKPPA